ncbi:tRNA (guanine-N7)-methyltransferase [Candidatus Gracilibacteria bacterium]|nr:MAG: tRNA (guanine-N7)-methyltransferase [Candidatus Gracilibacteria bacterium]
MINNPYIEKVKVHPKIFVDKDLISGYKGRWKDYFCNNNNIILEIGTGLGNFFSSEVRDNQNHNFIGMEIRYKRLYKTAEKTIGNTKNNDNSQIKVFGKEDRKVDNFVLLKEYGEKIKDIFGENEISKTYIFFPDPWDKKERQSKNRLLQKSFLNDLYQITKKGGKLIFKTDNIGYFDFVLSQLLGTSWKIVIKSNDYEKDNLYKQDKITEFEQIFRGQDIKINYLELKK